VEASHPKQIAQKTKEAGTAQSARQAQAERISTNITHATRHTQQQSRQKTAAIAEGGGTTAGTVAAAARSPAYVIQVTEEFLKGGADVSCLKHPRSQR
jgi:hypothetical protein